MIQVESLYKRFAELQAVDYADNGDFVYITGVLE